MLKCTFITHDYNAQCRAKPITGDLTVYFDSGVEGQITTKMQGINSREGVTYRVRTQTFAYFVPCPLYVVRSHWSLHLLPPPHLLYAHTRFALIFDKHYT